MSKKITAVLFGLIIFIGMTGFSSWGSFIKPVLWQIAYGYNQNPLPQEASPYERIINIRNNIEREFNNNIYPKPFYIELTGTIHSLLERNSVIDANPALTVIKLNNNHLTFLYKKKDVENVSNSLIALKSYLNQKDIGLLYVQAPGELSKFDNQLPVGFEDYSNQNIDDLLYKLSNADVDYIDLREEMHNANINQYEMFFVTDHHWKPEAALWAFGNVSKKLNARYGFDIDEELYNPDNYNYEVKYDWFLGSHGKRVGASFGGVDDISLITPEFETSFNLLLPDRDVEKNGDFKDTLLEYKHIEKKDYYYLNPYATYTGGDFPLALIRNNLATGKKVLLIRDSFGCAFAPFLALGCAELDAMDLRYYNGSLKQYIDDTNPDIVIFLYGNGLSEFDYP